MYFYEHGTLVCGTLVCGTLVCGTLCVVLWCVVHVLPSTNIIADDVRVICTMDANIPLSEGPQ